MAVPQTRASPPRTPPIIGPRLVEAPPDDEGSSPEAVEVVSSALSSDTALLCVSELVLLRVGSEVLSEASVVCRDVTDAVVDAEALVEVVEVLVSSLGVI